MAKGLADLEPAFLTMIWLHSDSLFTINVFVLIWMEFSKTERFQDGALGIVTMDAP